MKSRYFNSLLIIFVFLSASFVIHPSSVYSEFFSDDYDFGRRIDMIMGDSKAITVSNPQRLAIGDPKIADVISAGKAEILVAAKAAGETKLQIWDGFGHREIAVRVFAEDLSLLKKRLEGLFSTAGIRGVQFQIGEQEQKIFVLGDMPTRRRDVINQLLANFRPKLIDLLTYKEDNPLVEIDVQVMEIGKTLIDKLGIDWNESFTFTEVGVPAHDLRNDIGGMFKSLGVGTYTRDALTATLHALERDNLGRTLARPKLVALSGKEAKILVGGQIPTLSSVSTTSGTTTASVEYVDYGIKLNIRPEVKETGDIACRLEVEIKTVDSANSLTVSGTATPAFKTRNATTELYLKNEQTIFLAGLISSEEKNNLRQVPALGNLPILGMLFRSKDFQNANTELVISLTPKIVNYGDMRQEVELAQALKQGLSGEPADIYSRTVQEIILKKAGFPMEAQRANLSGGVVVNLHLLASGQLVNAVISESSGHKLLDNAALLTVKRLSPYPAFPKELMLKEIWVEVPITYQTS